MVTAGEEDDLSRHELSAEKLALLLVAAISFGVSVLHLLGLLEQEWIVHKIPTWTLLCVAVVVASLVLQQRTKLENIEKAIGDLQKSLGDSADRIIGALNGVEVTVFLQPKDLYEYVIKRIGEAERTVHDITWGLAARDRTPETRIAYDEYVETIKKVCAKGKVIYREIMSFPEAGHLSRAKEMFRQVNSSYEFGYYEISSKHYPPLISFVVIDSEEVILAFYRSGLLPEKEVRVAVKHPEIVRLFCDYYDVIWHGALRLEGPPEAAVSSIQEMEKRMMTAQQGNT